MAGRVQFSAEEAQRIIMSMPDGSDSDNPDFIGGEGDLDEGNRLRHVLVIRIALKSPPLLPWGSSLRVGVVGGVVGIVEEEW